MSHHLEVFRADGQLTSHAGLVPRICPPCVTSANFTPWYGEVPMEFTSCPSYMVNQLAALRFEPVTCLFRELIYPFHLQSSRKNLAQNYASKTLHNIQYLLAWLLGHICLKRCIENKLQHIPESSCSNIIHGFNDSV